MYKYIVEYKYRLLKKKSNQIPSELRVLVPLLLSATHSEQYVQYACSKTCVKKKKITIKIQSIKNQ